MQHAKAWTPTSHFYHRNILATNTPARIFSADRTKAGIFVAGTLRGNYLARHMIEFRK